MEKNSSHPPAALSPYGKLIEQGIALRAEGKADAALEIYKKAAVLPEADFVAFFNLGNVLFEQGQTKEARPWFEKALHANPELAAAALQLARCDKNLGRYEEARRAYVALLKRDPENFSAWLEVGHVCRELGDSRQMLAAYERASAVAPHRWEALLVLTRSLEEAGHFESAALTYHRAILAAGASGSKTNKPMAISQIHWQVARFRHERGDAARALEAMRQALMATRLESQDAGLDINVSAEMQIDLGDMLMRLGMTDEAHRAFERASAATSEQTLVRLAERSFQYNLWQESQEVLKRNVELHPGSAMAHWNLAHSYAESWMMEEALAELANAEAIAPQPGAKSMRASVAGRVGDVDTALALYQELAEEDGPLSKMRSSAAMSSLYSDKLSAQAVADLHRSLFAALGHDARSVDSFKNDLSPGRRLRLGMISADFHHQHPVNIFMQPVLARLDPAQFETTIYFTGVSHDDQTMLARRRVNHWVDATKMSDVQLTRRIEADGIDILLDLAGHTSLNRLQILGKRAAPVQVSYLGYPGSTGVPNIDWMIVDEVVAPPGCESLFTERLIRLPHTVFCYAPEMNYPFPVYTEDAAARPLTFGSFNNVPQLTPHTVKLWSAVLHEVPGSRLLLKAPSFQDESAIKLFKARFAAAGIAENRLLFRGPVGLADMMAEYADVDIALDPVPYNGGTTTLQALWMGVPVVVKAGNNFVSRMGASFMQAAGLADWVAQSDADYVAIAARMAADRKALLKLKQGLRDRLLKAPGWDVDAYTRDFEQGLRMAWQDYCKLK